MSDRELLTERLRAAVAAVEAANVPSDLREAAFTRTLDVLLGDSPEPISLDRDSEGRDRAGHGTRRSGGEQDGEPGLDALARRLQIDRRAAEAIYDVDDDGLHIVISPTRLADSVRAATDQIARLVVVGRKAAGLDSEWTSVEEIRRACNDRGKYDSPNFSRVVQGLDGDGFRIRGSRTKRELRANAVGFEQTRQLIEQLTSRG